MIVKIMSNGKSFKGLATYLTHDAEKAKSAERVAWTHTHNLAHDDIPCAVNDMVWTARDAELLKHESGVRGGGRATENPVKHLSLNWAPDQKPTREHMIETTGEFLRHMKWQDHQAIFVAHQDKQAHVHVMLNVVHPETGLRLDDNFERRRAQAWALEYERAHGHIYCEQRLMPREDREKAPPRNIWCAFRENEKDFAQAETALRQNEPISADEEKIRQNSEWQILKENQRISRMKFFAEGKVEFSQLRLSIYREVREEFRQRWADYYHVCRGGGDAEELAGLKAGLIADQKAILAARRDQACHDLKEYRAGLYRDLLDEQREARHDLRVRQEGGLDNAAFLEATKDDGGPDDVRAAFRDAADEATGRDRDEWNEHDAAPAEPNEHSGADSGTSSGGMLGPGLGLTLFDSFLSIFEGRQPGPRPRGAAAKELKVAADDAVKRQHRERDDEDADAAWRRARQRTYHGD